MIKRLAWDSGFFGYEVGMTLVESDLKIKQFLKEAQNYQLVYIYSKDYLPYVPENIKHICTKVNFQKRIAWIELSFQVPIFTEGDHVENEGIYEFPGLDFLANNGEKSNKNSPVYEALIDLALISGGFSHFKLDKRLRNKEFQRLYIQWILNAVSGKDKILLYIKNGKIGGLITLSLTKKYGRIGLLAVLEELRGRGIGSQLLKAAIEMASQAKMSILEVGTQKVNLPAMVLYQNNGFRSTEEMEVYHYTCFKK